MREWIVDIYTDKYQNWMKEFQITSVDGKYQKYFKARVTQEERTALLKILKRWKIPYHTYHMRWERNSHYRQDFFRLTKGPYRCRYCNKKLTGKYIEIDHIMPVAVAKKSVPSRNFLAFLHIYNINDLKNLAPSCKRCNRRKSDKCGWWTIKGYLGKYKLYWYVRRIIYFAIFIFGLYLLWDHGMIQKWSIVMHNF